MAKSKIGKAYAVGWHKGKNVGASISPRQAYRRGYRAGAIRKNHAWTKKAAAQSHYYYQMGKGSR